MSPAPAGASVHEEGPDARLFRFAALGLAAHIAELDVPRL
jgi:hypothetical protein